MRPPVTVFGTDWSKEEHAAWDALVERGYSMLERRMTEFRVPPFEVGAIQDVVLVWRLPEKPVQEKTKSGLYIPQTAQEKEEPDSLGVLLWGGLEALDVLGSHGALIGDIVRFAKFAGDEETASRVKAAIARAAQAAKEGADPDTVDATVDEAFKAQPKILQLRVAEVLGSVDYFERVNGPRPTMRVVRQVDAKGQPMHVIRPVVENIRV